MAPELQKPSPQVRDELTEAIATYGDRVSEVLVAMRDTGSSDAGTLFSATGASSPSAVYNYLRIIEAVLEAEIPPAPSIREKAAGWSRNLRKSMAATLTRESISYLDSLIVTLAIAATNQEDIEEEEREQTVRSAVVEERIRGGSGVYVYTYGHYERHPYVLLPSSPGAAITALFLMKIGHTMRGSDRVFQQESSAPEPIRWLRFYVAGDGRSPEQLEELFHRMLDRAGHPRAHPRGRGRLREWFATDVEFLDELADSWNLQGVGEEPVV